MLNDGNNAAMKEIKNAFYLFAPQLNILLSCLHKKKTFNVNKNNSEIIKVYF